MFQFSNAKMRVNRNPKRLVVEEFVKKLESEPEFDIQELQKWLESKIDFLYQDLSDKVYGQRCEKASGEDPKIAETLKDNWNGCIDRIRAVIASVNIKL